MQSVAIIGRERPGGMLRQIDQQVDRRLVMNDAGGGGGVHWQLVHGDATVASGRLRAGARAEVTSGPATAGAVVEQALPADDVRDLELAAHRSHAAGDATRRAREALQRSRPAPELHVEQHGA